MKKIALSLIILPVFLSGCNLTDSNSNSWTVKEEIDKLNNSKYLIASRTFKNSENTAQVFLDFQCTSDKALILKIGAYGTKEIKDEFPGVSLLPSRSQNMEYIKTRAGENKMAFPLIGKRDFNNISNISLSGLDSISALGARLTLGFSNEIESGYKLAIESTAIQNIFKTSEWILEIPTEKGTVVPSIDLSDTNIQKVFNYCSWKPAFSKSNTSPAVSSSNNVEKSPEKKPFKLSDLNGKWSGWAGNNCTDPLVINGDKVSLSNNEFDQVNTETLNGNLLIKEKANPKDQGLLLSNITNDSMTIESNSSGDKFKLTRCN
jgi:hypothetical protein